MHVFCRDLIEITGVVAAPIENCVERCLNLFSFISGKHSGSRQSLAMRQARAHIGVEQSAIKAERSIKFCERWVGLTLKSAAPQILLCIVLHPLLLASS